MHTNAFYHAIVFHSVEIYKVYISAAVFFKLGQLPTILNLTLLEITFFFVFLFFFLFFCFQPFMNLSKSTEESSRKYRFRTSISYIILPVEYTQCHLVNVISTLLEFEIGVYLLPIAREKKSF